jgi:hypothetical protein
LALARFVPISSAMSTSRPTAAPVSSARPRLVPEPITPSTTTDRASETHRSPAQPSGVAQRPSRPAEPHWESVIDLATD